MSDASDNTKGHKNLIPYKPGQSGNLKGRPKGSRNKIQEAFLQDYFEAWLAYGRSALLNAAYQDPVGFVKVAASLMPKAVSVAMSIEDKRNESDWSRDELVAFLNDARKGRGNAAKANGRDREPDCVH